jgi:integrase/recombinase XerD
MASRFSQPVREFLTYLRVECGLAENTLSAYGADLKRLRRSLASRGVADPAEIEGTHLVEHLRDLRHEGLDSTSIARHLATLRAFGRFLVHYNYREHDPAELLERPTAWRRLPRGLPVDHIEKLLEAPDPAERLYLRDRSLLELMYATGCRAGEVGLIRLEDWDETLGVVRITGKGARQRIVPVGRPAMRIVREYLTELRPELVREERPSDRLLLTERGTPMSRFTVFAVVKKHAARAGLSEVHPHKLRHTFATHLLSGGADLRVVQELLGHARITTTQVYTHVDQSRLKSVVERHHPRP